MTPSVRAGMNCVKFKCGAELNISESVAPMKVKKTILALIVFLTRVKKQLLEQEYSNLQHFLRGERDVPYTRLINNRL